MTKIEEENEMYLPLKNALIDTKAILSNYLDPYDVEGIALKLIPIFGKYARSIIDITGNDLLKCVEDHKPNEFLNEILTEHLRDD